MAGFGMLLRDSDYKGSLSYDKLLEWTAGTLQFNPYGYREEFRAIIAKARDLYLIILLILFIVIAMVGFKHVIEKIRVIEQVSGKNSYPERYDIPVLPYQVSCKLKRVLSGLKQVP